MNSENNKNIGLGIADLLAEKRAQILEIVAQHEAYNVRVFGSVFRMR